MSERSLNILASVGLAVGGIFGMVGTFVPTASLRGLAWGIDGIALVMAAALLAVAFFRKGHDLVAAGFLVFLVGQTLVVSTSAMELAAGAPLFGAGISLWALALVLIGVASAFPLAVRIIGFVAALLFGIAAAQIYAGVPLTALSSPLPQFAYPIFVLTLVGWIWTLLKVGIAPGTPR